MAGGAHHVPMPIHTYIAVTMTRRLVEQGGPKPRFVRGVTRRRAASARSVSAALRGRAGPGRGRAASRAASTPCGSPGAVSRSCSQQPSSSRPIDARVLAVLLDQPHRQLDARARRRRRRRCRLDLDRRLHLGPPGVVRCAPPGGGGQSGTSAGAPRCTPWPGRRARASWRGRAAPPRPGTTPRASRQRQSELPLSSNAACDRPGSAARCRRGHDRRLGSPSLRARASSRSARDRSGSSRAPPRRARPPGHPQVAQGRHACVARHTTRARRAALEPALAASPHPPGAAGRPCGRARGVAAARLEARLEVSHASRNSSTPARPRRASVSARELLEHAVRSPLGGQCPHLVATRLPARHGRCPTSSRSGRRAAALTRTASLARAARDQREPVRRAREHTDRRQRHERDTAALGPGAWNRRHRLTSRPAPPSNAAASARPASARTSRPA